VPRIPRHPNKFRKTEATRLVRALLDAGLDVAHVELDPSGRVTAFPVQPIEPPETTGTTADALARA